MKILPVHNNDNKSLNSVNFKRKPTVAEYKHYVPTIKEGLQVLNKELGFIIHNSSVPSNPRVNTGIGTLLRDITQSKFLQFIIMIISSLSKIMFWWGKKGIWGIREGFTFWICSGKG